ncbi:MAG: hypothetical protein IJD11_02170, partial [Oscillospiraceae bacterium]|nr:hypothetical protein [Oscillospiraceae bacterium]
MNKKMVISTVIVAVIVIALILGVFAVFLMIQPTGGTTGNSSSASSGLTDSSTGDFSSDTSSMDDVSSGDMSSEGTESDQQGDNSTGNGNSSLLPEVNNSSTVKPSGNGTIDNDIKASKQMANLATAAVKTTGQSAVAKLSSKLWEDAPEYDCRTMTGQGSSITFVISGLSPKKELTLEVEEIHQRTDDVFAYTVIVNGQEVYFRTYDPSSDGKNHYFIPVDGSLIGADGKATITFKNEHATTVRFARVWGYSSMDTLMKVEGVNRKMSVSLLAPSLTYNLSTDKVTINRLVQSFGNSDMYDISFGLELFYLSSTPTEFHNKVDHIIKLSAETGVTFRIGLNSWWAGTPAGPDGLGGYFNDINYHQVIYDPLNINGRGKWQLSTPNQWSNVPWLTMNSDTLNTARNYRLQDATSHIQKRLAEYRVAGGKQPSVTTYMENEPLYWAYTAYNGSPNGGADFNSMVVAAAKKDGVTLNPEDGLSLSEKLWLHKNIGTYIDQEGEAVANGYQYDAVIVNNGNVTLPTSQQVENTYTHMFPEEWWPMNDKNYALWETHSISSLRLGGEWAAELNDERALDYMSALGKFANVNAERSAISDYMGLPQAYLYGTDHFQIYNFSTADASLYKAASNRSEALKEVKDYYCEIMSYDFMDENSLKPGDVLVDATDIERTALNSAYVAGPSNTFAKGGTLTFKIDNKGKAFSNGLVLELNGRILSDLASAARMTVFAGSSVDDMQEVTKLRSLTPNRVDLSDAIDKSQSVVYVKIQLSATQASFKNWVSLSNVKAYTKWSKDSGSTNGTQYTYTQLRNRNLFMGYRADTERMLQNYLDRAGKDSIYERACELYNGNRYVSAYNLLLSNISETLPAKYMVKGNGQLGKYNITMDLGNKDKSVYVELTKAAAENYVFTMESYDNVTVKVTFGGLTNGSYYKLNTVETGKFELVKVSSANGAVLAANGKAEFSIALGATSSITPMPSSFEAKAYADGGASSIKIQAQDYRVSEFANYITLNVASGCKVWIGNDGDSDSEMTASRASAIKAGDYLKIKVNELNKAVELLCVCVKLAAVE